VSVEKVKIVLVNVDDFDCSKTYVKNSRIKVDVI
jgi:hypothetical protein